MDAERENRRITAERPTDSRASLATRGGWFGLLVLVSGCAAEPAARPPPGLPPAVVRIGQAERSLRPVVTEVVGNVRAARDATIDSGQLYTTTDLLSGATFGLQAETWW